MTNEEHQKEIDELGEKLDRWYEEGKKSLVDPDFHCKENYYIVRDYVCEKILEMFTQVRNDGKKEGRNEAIEEARQETIKFTIDKYDPRVSPLDSPRLKLVYEIAQAIEALKDGAK